MKIVLRMRADEYAELPWVSECEKAIKALIEKLSDKKLIVVPRGFGTESSEVIDAPVGKKIEYLDYEVMFNGKVIAVLEISCTRYSFAGSRFFPIRDYKFERPERLPTFFVYSLEKEPYELAERCWWITFQEAKNNLLEKEPVLLSTKRPGGIKEQWNYLTDKNAWNRGLQSLIDELKNLKPKSLQ